MKIVSIDFQTQSIAWKKPFTAAKKAIGANIQIEMLTLDTNAEKKVAEFIQYQPEDALPGLKVKIKAVH